MNVQRRTSNVEHPTQNFEVQRSKFDVGRSLSALLMAVAGCAIVPAARDDLPETTEFTISEEGKVVEIPTAADRAFKFELIPKTD